MKKSTQLLILLFVVLAILLSGCASSTPILPTFTPEPTAIPFVMPKGDFEMSWNIYNNEYNSLGGIVTIRRQGSKYTEKIVYSDGSNGVFDLTIISEGTEIKLSGHLGDPYDLYPHDYIQIESNGWLGFYDDQGYIYGVPPLK
ncbi:MAG: hypothetical protein GYA59_11485 [Chloroflexi bacterium]|nr:hypothetical protein [Chloroflexota bacterium]